MALMDSNHWVSLGIVVALIAFSIWLSRIQ